MRSVVEELMEKIAAESRPGPRPARSLARGARSVARADLGMVLFVEREAIDTLWKAADAAVRAGAPAGLEGSEAAALATAVDRLRPLFGPRG